MQSITEFLVKKHQQSKKITLSIKEILDKYNPEYIIMCYYHPNFDSKEIEKGYIICMGTENECCNFAGVDKWKESFIEGISTEFDDKVVKYIKDNFNEEVNLDDFGWFIEFHKVEELIKTINKDAESFNDKFTFIA